MAFNAQWFRVAVDPETGELRVLRSVHSADAGTVMNPLQCRGQIEGGVAQALGAAPTEHVDVGPDGRVTTTWRESDAGPPRKYYAITAKGRSALTDFTSQWRLFRDAVDTILAKGTT